MDNKRVENKFAGLIKKLTKKIIKHPQNIEFYKKRAKLYMKIQDYSKAINDYKKILEIDPSCIEAATSIEMLETTIRFINIDVYANTNLTKDPWFD